ncbi:MAG: flagellar hook-associated protein 3 FlgL [Desulfobacteraceae bacterium Eth-SRB1]|nr:MAG: flagellar hook-associated protein 3 FlgL [Desulfobacteraceae bacterium Eth-SRB1]
MVMRISENIKFNTIVDNMFKSQDSYNKLAEKIASLKEINRPSDDPIGMNRVLNLRESRASVEQYTRNMNGCESWLTITESKLSAAGDLLIRAREVAVAQSTATASAEMRSAEAGTVQQLIDEMLSLANSKYDGKYLFSGAKTGEEPFSSSRRSTAEIGTAIEAEGNGDFDGTVTSGGVYSGTENGTYVVKIVAGGTLADATYKVSDDGGKNWSEGTPAFGALVDDAATITLGDGVELTFTKESDADHYLAKDDIFYVQALAPGYYNGNGEELSVNIGEGTPFAYSISGEAAFTDKGEGNVEIFSILNKLKDALDNNEPDTIASCLDDLKAASDQIIKNISKCGARMNRLEIAKNNMADMEMDLTGLISEVEDADVSEIITKFAMKEIALKASYTAASRIGNLTILDFLR